MDRLPVVAAIKDRYAIQYHASRGLVVLTLMGFLASEESKTCLSQLGDQWENAYRSHGRVLLLIDASKSGVQSPVILDELRHANAQTVGAGDRVAFVVSSNLLKMQFRRATRESPAAVEFFLSTDAAETWILA